MKKYDSAMAFDFEKRTWPSQIITKSPIWCSVDLRDGNQSLANPMDQEQKMNFYKLLIEIGFKEIEVSFPSSSKIDFDFTRSLIEQSLIPSDCTIQVLTQAKDHLIQKTMDAIYGCKRAIFHLYNSTSPAQREIVFRKSPREIIAMAVDNTKLIRDLSTKQPGEIIFEYSPESFSQTEMNFACDICNAVIDAWSPKEYEKVIINLPSTVEVASPNVFADQIEFVSKNLIYRENIILSVHTHNDRGCATAAAELAQLAGAQRVEGTLFGNGERTGNTDLVVLALNLYSQGIDPGLNIFNIPEIQAQYEKNTRMPIHPRHPYAGELVFTAFSGSHQDAISKGLANYKSTGGQWNVPYLPIDPTDIGKSYEAIIRINSQSGKGGAAYIMESAFGFQIPKSMHPLLGQMVKNMADTIGRELTNNEVKDCFFNEFVVSKGDFTLHSLQFSPAEYNDMDSCTSSKREVSIIAKLTKKNSNISISGTGNGPIDAFSKGLKTHGIDFKIVNYHEHSVNEGSDAKAVAYITISDSKSQLFHGAGIDTDIAFASCQALICAINKMVI